MPLTREFFGLLRGTLRLWVRFLPQVGTWLAIGWTVYTVCMYGSAQLGGWHKVVALLVFVLGLIANVICLIFAILALKPGLLTTRRLRDRGRGAPSMIPPEVLMKEPRVEVALVIIGPLLGVYSVWAVIDDMIRDGFVWNSLLRATDPDAWSLSFKLQHFPLYATIAVAALLLRLLWAGLFPRRRPPWLRTPLLFFEGMWVFATFFVVTQGAEQLYQWLTQRQFWRDGERLFAQFIDWLPEIRLPFDLTLPEAITAAWLWLWETFLPGLWQGVAYPLVWLAIVGMIFGWRDLRVAGLLSGRFRARAERVNFGAGPRANNLATMVNFVTADLRDKYLPLLHALRLIWRSGPYVLGAYVVLWNLCEFAIYRIGAVTQYLLSAGTQFETLLAFNLLELGRTMTSMSLLICLYAATFDRGLADAAGGAHVPPRVTAPPESIVATDPRSAAPTTAPRPRAWRSPGRPAGSGTPPRA